MKLKIQIQIIHNSLNSNIDNKYYNKTYMNSFLSSPIISWTGIFGLAIIGLFAIIGFFKKKKDEKTDETNKADDRLVGLLQGTVDQLEKRLESQTASLTSSLNRITAIETENTVYKELFQGRDIQMQKFMKDGFETMALVPDMIEMMKRTNENVEQLYKILITQNKALVEVASKT